MTQDENLCLSADSYKLSQFPQYPKNTTLVSSYVESRGGRFSETVQFGLQYIIKRYLLKPITQENIDEAALVAGLHGMPFNKSGWQHILDEHKGLLPLRIKAVPEGMVIPTHNVLAVVENTDPKCFWLTSYMETMLLRVWYPITVATQSFYCKRIIKRYMEETCETLDGLPFKLHDFGSRGVSSRESAGIGGLAHTINFMGSDTLDAILFGRRYYNSEMAAFSIPASEHSTITAWGREGEFDAYENMLDQFKDSPLLACVSDSYNIYEAIKMWGKLKPKIIANGQTLVVRPDSGDPVTMSLECVELLEKEFGSTRNNKGYKVLDNVRVIYGDGISNEGVIMEILEGLKQKQYSAENMAFGMGGGLLQKLDRDTQKFAMKCSAITSEGVTVPVYKDPITDPGKKSKRGFLDLTTDVHGKFQTVERDMPGDEIGSILRTVFENGKLLIDDSLDTIRKRTEEAL
jgi:nicotinamide phosphoribosyltransferase